MLVTQRRLHPLPCSKSRLRTLEHAAVAEAVAVAVANDAGLHKCAVAGDRNRVRVIVAQVEMAWCTCTIVTAPTLAANMCAAAMPCKLCSGGTARMRAASALPDERQRSNTLAFNLSMLAYNWCTLVRARRLRA